MTAVAHVLVVGSPDRCGGLLHESAPGARVSVLCDEAALAGLPGLDDTDQVLAVATGTSWDGEVDLVLAAQTRHPVTHVAAFTPDRYREAAHLARLLDVPVLPTVGPALDRAVAPPGPVPAGELIVPVLAEQGDAIAVAVVARVPADPSLAAVVDGYLVGPDLLAPEALAAVERSALAAAASTGLRTGVATAVRFSDGVTAATVEARIDLPAPVVTRLLAVATGVDLARCLAQQAVGEPVLEPVRARLAGAGRDAVCVCLVREAPISTPDRPGRVDGVDEAEAHPSGGVRVDLQPDAAGDVDPARAWLWSRAPGVGAALRVAREAVASIRVPEERTRPWLS